MYMYMYVYLFMRRVYACVNDCMSGEVDQSSN